MHKYSTVRVGVAGVTGYAGLELLRRLARHPGADVRLAMASGASESKRLPSLGKIWDRPDEPLDIERLATETDAPGRVGNASKPMPLPNCWIDLRWSVEQALPLRGSTAAGRV